MQLFTICRKVLTDAVGTTHRISYFTRQTANRQRCNAETAAF